VDRRSGAERRAIRAADVSVERDHRRRDQATANRHYVLKAETFRVTVSNLPGPDDQSSQIA
jgi:hypothetical protein